MEVVRSMLMQQRLEPAVPISSAVDDGRMRAAILVRSDVVTSDTALLPAVVERPDPAVRIQSLQDQLRDTMRAALPAAVDADKAFRRAHSLYEDVARVLIDLRHEFAGPCGEKFDLRGRSKGYREVVRRAYAEAGVTTDGPIAKRITVGVSYWTKKLLLERYGEEAADEDHWSDQARDAVRRFNGTAKLDYLTDKPSRLALAATILNELATEPSFVPTEEAVHALIRAVSLLRSKLAPEL